MLIRPLGTHLSDNLIQIQAFLFKKMHLKWRAFCLGLNVLNSLITNQFHESKPEKYKIWDITIVSLTNW